MKQQQIEALWGHLHWLGVLADAGSYTAVVAVGGLGLAVLSDFTARQALLDGLLVPVLPDWRPVGLFGDCLCAIRPYSPTVPKAVQVFVAWLREALKDGFPLAR